MQPRTTNTPPASARAAFDQVHYRDRNTVEREINKLRAHRRGTVSVAAISIWLRNPGN